MLSIISAGVASAAGYDLEFTGGVAVPGGGACTLNLGDRCRFSNVVIGAGTGSANSFQRDIVVTVTKLVSSTLGVFDDPAPALTATPVAAATPTQFFSPSVQPTQTTPNITGWAEFTFDVVTPGGAAPAVGGGTATLPGVIWASSFDTDGNGTLTEFVEFIGIPAVDTALSVGTTLSAGTAVDGGVQYQSAATTINGISTDPAYKASAVYTNPASFKLVYGARTGANGSTAGARLTAFNFLRPDAVLLRPAVDGYKSVRLTTDADGNGIASPGDTLTYTVTYANTGNTAETNFQIVDALPAGLTVTAAGAQTVRLNGTVTAAARDATYTGAGTTTNLLAAGQTLPVNGTVSVDIPVKINTVAAATTTLANQTTTSGSYVNTAGTTVADTSKPSDNVDTTTTFPPSVSSATGFGTVPTGSLAQTQAATTDPTTVTVTRQTLTISKSFSPSTVQAGGVTALTFTVTNPYTVATSALAVTDDIAGTMGLSKPLPLRVTSTTCGGTITTGTGNTALVTNATATESNDGILKLTGGSLAANASCTVTVNVTVIDPAATTRTNTIPAANVTGTLNGQAITAAAPATATLTTTASTAGSPYTCDARFYQLRQDPTTLLSNLYQLDRRNLGAVGAAQWSSGFGPGLNALGFNKADGYFYAINITPFTSGSPFRLYRLGQSGALEVFNLTNIPAGSTIAAATVDASGVMYIHTLAQETALYRVQLPTTVGGAISNLSTLTIGNYYVFDLAFNPVDGFLYGVFTPGGVIKINVTTGATTQIGTFAGFTTANAVGSAFFDVSGTMYAYQNGGTFGTVDLTTGAFTALATASVASQSDGASCVFPDQKLDVVKSAGAVTVVSATVFRVPYTVTVKNTGTVTDPNVQLTEDLNRTFSAGSPTITISTAPTITAGTATLGGGFNGTSATGLLSGTDSLAAGASVTVTFTVQLSYAGTANVPATVQNNSVYASTTSTGSNAGYTFVGGAPVPPVDLLATDTSANGTTPPASANSDTASPTPVLLNVPPVAVNDAGATPAGTAVTFSVTGNDTDTAPGTVAAATTTFPVAGQPGGATVSNGGKTITVTDEGSYTLDNAGSVTFTPAAGYSGTTTAVKYTVNDNLGAASNTAIITVTVTPVATNDTATTAPSTLVNIPVLGNDLGSGKVPTSLLFPAAGQPTGSVLSNGGKTLTNADGVYTIRTDGTVDFTPALGKTGALSPVLYTFVDGAGQTSNPASITVTVSAITPPVAVNDSKTTPKSTAVTLEGSTNDTQKTLSIDNATVVLTSGGTITNGGKTLTNAEGQYQVQVNGTVIFTPVSTFAGTATPVSYTVKDTAGTVSNAATLSVTVTNQPPVAANATNVLLTSTAPATALSPGISGTDPDGTVVTYTITSLPTAATGTLYCSGTAIASVPSVCAPGNLTFKPNPAFNGNATFQYTVTDDNGATSAAATYTLPVNKPPVAVNDSGATNPLTSVTFSITGNDTDTAPGTVDATTAVFDPSSTGTISNAGKTLTITGEGVYTIASNGNVTFVPAAGFNNGTSTAKYTVKDNNGAVSNVATITVTVPASVDLAISKAGPAYFRPGDTLAYTLTVTNSGSAATGVSVTDTLPTGLTFVSASSGGTYNAGTGKVGWTLGNVANGATVTLTVTGAAPSAASVETNSGPTSLVNTASVAANESEVVTINNAATSTAQLVYPKLSKRVRNVTTAGAFGTTGTGKPGEVLEYCIDFRNYGVAVAGFVLSDTVPANTTANLSAYGAGLGLQVTRSTVTTRTSTGSDADGGTLSASALSADLGSLTAGESGGVCFQSSIK